MPLARWLADAVTWLRVGIALALAGLGLARPPDLLVLAAVLMVLDWTGDILDGVLARRGPAGAHSWIGDHDLQVDMLVAAGLLACLAEAGYVHPVLAAGYLAVGLAVFWSVGRSRWLGMLLQAPIYGGLIVLSVLAAPLAAALMLGWIAAAVAVTWPRLLTQVVPGFLAGLPRGRPRPGQGRPPPEPHVRTGRSSR